MRYTPDEINTLIVNHLFFDEYSTAFKPDFTGTNDELFDELTDKLKQYGYQIVATELPYQKLYVTLKSTVPASEEGNTTRVMRGHLVDIDHIGLGTCIAFLKTMGVIL